MSDDRKHEFDALNWCAACGIARQDAVESDSQQCPGDKVVNIERARSWRWARNLFDEVCGA